jgi:tetratricopeptide (TPR) repeat protein
MSAESLEIVKSEYQAGKEAFERGQYRQSVQNLEKAAALVDRNTRLGGEVQIWLVTAYEAAGQVTEAIALCKQLERHPSYETRKQGSRLRYILEAPKLKRPAEWMSKIPDLGAIPDNEAETRLGKAGGSFKSAPLPRPRPEPVDLSEVNTKDNQFIWVALVAIALTLIGFLWFS